MSWCKQLSTNINVICLQAKCLRSDRISVTDFYYLILSILHIHCTQITTLYHA